MIMRLNTDILILGDVHLAHHRTSTEDIIKTIKETIFPFIINQSIKMLIIEGDLFDRRISINDPDHSLIILFISELIDLLANNNVALRVLEGTPSHDWKQSRLFKTLIDQKESSINYAYFDDIAIEDNNVLNKTILYIPDEWGISSEYTYNHVLKLLKDKHLSRVDYIVMHGMFDYQVASLPNAPFMKAVHNSTNYLSICNYYIFIGHVHTFSSYERIIATGSFQRLAHNEEENKGCLLYTHNDDLDKCQYRLIPNQNAKIYKTITLPSNMEKSEKLIAKTISKLPIDSHLRVVCKKDNHILSIWNKLQMTYLDYNLSKKVIDKDVSKPVLDVSEIKDSFHISQTNIKDIVYERINKLSLDHSLKQCALTEFDLVLKELSNDRNIPIS